MARSTRYGFGTLWLITGLAVLLVILAALQYRWLKHLSEGESIRLRAGIESSAERFCDDFDRELSRLFIYFSMIRESEGADLLAGIQQQHVRWQAESPYPTLLREIYIATRADDGGMGLLKVDPAKGEAVPCEWPAEMEPLRDAGSAAGEPGPPIVSSLPGLVIPTGAHFFERLNGDRPTQPRRLLIVELNMDFITSSLLPELTERHFARGTGVVLDVGVSRGPNARELIYRRGELKQSSRITEQPLFSIRMFPELLQSQGQIPFGPRLSPAGSQEHRKPPDGRELPPSLEHASRRRAVGPFEGQWRLIVAHSGGTLEEAVQMVHIRQVALSLSVLLLLGMSCVMVVVSSRRAHRLATQQMEFVAAVSHELCTPLTGIRSAGQNLADGIVSESEQVRHYGALIEREGRRLTEMVNGVLAFAGMLSGRKSYAFMPVSLEAIIDEVLSELPRAHDAGEVVVERQFAPDLPIVNADAAALRRMFYNLFDNAVKYAAAEKWIGLVVKRVVRRGTDGVEIAVSDRGRGIAKSETRRIFEPFYRGEDAIRSGIQGSGIGLSVVKHVVDGHGGVVTVESSPGRGTSFTIWLPVAAPASGGES